MKVNKQFVFSIFVGVMMITWAIGMALQYNIDVSPGKGAKIETVYRELLTGQEKVSILRTGRVLIEYLYMTGPGAVDKSITYENFAARFGDLIVLQIVEVSQSNQTVDQMIVPTGDVIPLNNVSESELFDVFCKNTYVQPKECLLRNI
ncbi:MAG: hypothetical protein JW789_04085 [Candidatus Aenigmarchaeota archaeon]|nr:hypothetical protein [Candidatus Aenigmarchaeota archaeon]